MKSFFVVPAMIMMLLCGCRGEKESPAPSSLMEISRQELVTALNERDELLALVREISDGMEQINRLEHLMTMSGSRESHSRRSTILAEIAAIQSTLAQRRRQLADLEERLRKSSLYTAELGKTVETMHSLLRQQTQETDRLRAGLSEAHQRIGVLTGEVDSLNVTITSVNENLDSAQSVSERLENELNRCYYVAASRSLLRKHAIIETGFLRKSRLMKGDFDSDFFTVADKRVVRQIPLRSRKAKLLTNHPEASYTIHVSGGQQTLSILDQQKFWSLSNYLVIELD